MSDLTRWDTAEDFCCFTLHKLAATVPGTEIEVGTESTAFPPLPHSYFISELELLY